MLTQDHVTTRSAPPTSQLDSSLLNLPVDFDLCSFDDDDNYEFADDFWMSANPTRNLNLFHHQLSHPLSSLQEQHQFQRALLLQEHQQQQPQLQQQDRDLRRASDATTATISWRQSLPFAGIATTSPYDDGNVLVTQPDLYLSSSSSYSPVTHVAPDSRVWQQAFGDAFHLDNTGGSGSFTSGGGSVVDASGNPYALAVAGAQQQQKRHQQGRNLSPSYQPKPLYQHRRALSSSTMTSQASTASPMQSSVQYPNSQPQLNQHTSVDPGSFRHLQNHHYPTPTHTPTQDSFMDRAAQASRRGTGGPTSMAGSAASGRSDVSSAPNSNLIAHQPQHRTSVSNSQYTSSPYENYPATPNTSNGDYQHGGGDVRYGMQQYAHPIPRLEPSMTQACADELYNPTVGAPPLMSSAQQQQQQQQLNMGLLNPNDMRARLSAASEARSKSPVDEIKREPSPYREGSKYALENQGYIGVDGIRTAAAQRQQQKWQDDRYQQWRHQTRGQDPESQQQPKTISPKDAYVDDFHDPAEEESAALGNAPLFPHAYTPTSSGPDTSRNQQLFNDVAAYRQPSYASLRYSAAPPMSSTIGGQTATPSIVGGSSQEFHFAPLRQSSSNTGADTPTHLISMDTSKSEPESSLASSSQETAASSSLPPARPQHRPAPRGSSSISAADTGTYSCTYSGCTDRFATPALLQKHKRDFHRSTTGGHHHNSSSLRRSTQSPRPGESQRTPGSSATPTSAPATGSDSSADINRNSQAGPHRCDRTNPSTGKPCNTVFSRPYDLTRHEDTIHARRPKVHCQYCAERGEEKTFSRADALTRHLRVVHPDIEPQHPKSSKLR